MRSLVLAALVQHRQDHQVRLRKQPMFRLLTHRLCRTGDKADVPRARQMAEMFEADARQSGSLRVRKDLLASLDLDHAFALNHRFKERPMARRWPGPQRGPLALYSWPFSS